MKNNPVEKTEKNLTNLIGTSKKHKILVAFSGGPDSVFLLYALVLISEKTGFKLGAAHLNHCLRGEDSVKDENFCRNFASKHNIDFFCERVQIKKEAENLKTSEEDAGRKKRYEFFESVSKMNKYDFIATAHQKDDNAEQVLMNIIRGSGVEGLTGIPAKRDNIIRPVLNIEKNEILDFLHNNNIDYCTDKTNFETDFLRNKVRNSLIPYLEKNYNSLIKKSLFNLADIAKGENIYINKAFKKDIENFIELKDNTVLINLKYFNNKDYALKRRILRYALKKIKGNLLRIELNHIDKIIETALSEGTKKIHLPDQIFAVKYYNTIEIKKSLMNLRDPDKSEDQFFYEKIENCPDNRMVIKKNQGCKIEIYTEKSLTDNDKTDNESIHLNPENLDFPLILRQIKPGDRFTPKNFHGRKKIKKILNEKKLSPDEKKEIVLLESGEKIMWISGLIKNHFNALPEKGKKTIVIKRILG
ncbi:MAG: tRNA lysidine(34) synthetase TilS [Thermodesulfobacteriota bacterium]